MSHPAPAPPRAPPADPPAPFACPCATPAACTSSIIELLAAHAPHKLPVAPGLLKRYSDGRLPLLHAYLTAVYAPWSACLDPALSAFDPLAALYTPAPIPPVLDAWPCDSVAKAEALLSPGDRKSVVGGGSASKQQRGDDHEG